MSTYRRIAEGELVERSAEGLDQLVALGLVESANGHYRLADVRQVRDRMIARARSGLEALTLISEVSAVPAHGTGTAPEYLEGLDVINERLDQEVSGAQSEILSAHPHVLQRQRQYMARDRDLAAMQRGVTMRTLYPAAARGRSATRDWVREMSARGGEYRVLSTPFSRCIVIDRRVAFIDNLVTQGGDPSARCVVVQDLAVAAFLGQVFDSAWERALGWGSRPERGTVTTPVQRAILRELINDRTQEGAARALDMSSRSVEQHLRELRSQLGVASTYAALAWWLRSDETELD